jgi:nicotinamide mononucleotide transporter
MEASTAFWSIDFALLELGDYTLSLIELLAVVFSLMGAYFSRLGWLLMLLANVCFFLFFHQIQLYGLMAAQVILFIFNLVWGIRSAVASGQPIKKLDSMGLVISFIAIFMPGISLVLALIEVPDYFPEYFPLPATFAMLDAWLALGSIVATVLLARRFIEAWVYWIIIHSLLIVVLAWKGYYVATAGQMVLLGRAANEYLLWQSLAKSTFQKNKSKN